MSWESFYRSDVQGLYGLVAVPALFLLWLAAVRPAATTRTERFVRAWAIVFAIETIVDPVVTGPVYRWLGLEESAAALLPFVLLGDFRVFVLACFLRAPDRGLGGAVAEAAAWTLVVPLVTWAVTAGLHAALGALPGVSMWLVYEITFVVVALIFRGLIVPRGASGGGVGERAYVRSLLLYVVAYYALWAVADTLLLAGVDAGWGLRILPNQLYYALWVPFAYGLFVSRRYAATSRAVQAAR